jgi:hypothetical protein
LHACGSGDDVGKAVAVHIGDGNAYASQEAWLVSHEVQFQFTVDGIVLFDFGSHAGARSDGDPAKLLEVVQRRAYYGRRPKAR